MPKKLIVLFVAVSVLAISSIACNTSSMMANTLQSFPSSIVNPPNETDQQMVNPTISVPTVSVPTMALKSFDGLPPMSYDCYLGKGGGYGTPGHIYCFPSSGTEAEWDLTAICLEYPGTYVCEWPEVKKTLT